MKRNIEETYVKVTTTKLYCFQRNHCNNWPIEMVIDRWLREYPLDSFHAARDSARVGYSQKLVAVEVIEEKDVEAYFKETK